jgi:hypothetical protein
VTKTLKDALYTQTPSLYGQRKTELSGLTDHFLWLGFFFLGFPALPIGSGYLPLGGFFFLAGLGL